jgi:hypothetical protein
MRPEMLQAMKQIAINEVEDLETEFPEVLVQSRGARDALNNLKTLIGTVTDATPANVVIGIGARIGSLRMLLTRYSGLTVEELLNRRRSKKDTTVSSAYVPVPDAPTEALRSTALEARRVREERLRAIEQEIAALRRAAKLRRLETIEREIARLRARRRT